MVVFDICFYILYFCPMLNPCATSVGFSCTMTSLYLSLSKLASIAPKHNHYWVVGFLTQSRGQEITRIRPLSYLITHYPFSCCVFFFNLTITLHPPPPHASSSFSPIFSHHHFTTLTSGYLSASRQSSRIGLVEIYCTNLFFRPPIQTSIYSIPTSRISSANRR